VQDVNQALAESFGLSQPDGALISRVNPGSAAAKAGLQAGDVILEVNGQKVAQAGSLSSLISMTPPGETVALKVWREHKEHSLKATLGNAEDSKTAQAKPGSADGAEDGTRLGLSMRPLSPQESRQLGSDQGLLIQDLDASGPAARAGVAAGDVLLAINGKPIQSIEDIRAILKNHPKQVALLVRRQGDTVFVPVPLG
jgi:serine protease Do